MSDIRSIHYRTFSFPSFLLTLKLSILTFHISCIDAEVFNALPTLILIILRTRILTEAATKVLQSSQLSHICSSHPTANLFFFNWSPPHAILGQLHIMKKKYTRTNVLLTYKAYSISLVYFLHSSTIYLSLTFTDFVKTVCFNLFAKFIMKLFQ